MAKPLRLSLDAFKAAAKAAEKDGTKLGDELVVLRDLPSAEIKAVDGQGESPRVFEFVISTPNPADDRSNDFIALDGWKLDRYRLNPVVMYGHQTYGGGPEALPIAASPLVWTESGRLKAKADFTASYDITPMARYVCQMLAAKPTPLLNAASVGFQPIVYAFNDKRGAFAMDFIEQELLEWSVVPVPANAACLQSAKAMGIDLAPLVEWSEKFLDGERGPGLWVPKSLLTDDLVAKARAIAAGAPVSVQVPAQVEPPPPPPEPTVEDVVKEIKAIAEKAGRVLSAANESTLQQAADSIQTAADSIEAVLAQVAPKDEPSKAAETVFVFADSEPETPVEVTPEDMKALADRIDRRVHETLILPLTGQLY